MATETPAWLTAITILAPIFASFGVLWLSNRQQSSNLKAQHDLSLEKAKITAAVSKAEELYSDIQKRRRYFEIECFRYITAFMHSPDKDVFLKKIVDESDPVNFDLVRTEMNFKAYFPDLEAAYRDAESLIHKAGMIQASMLRKFDLSDDEKRDINGELVNAQREAVESLDELSQAIAHQIGQIMILPKQN